MSMTVPLPVALRTASDAPRAVVGAEPLADTPQADARSELGQRGREPDS